ncbi:hypothetical protein N7523_010326 [Penicillium sp. IBT 18751x]|nr:hypothetical protein N7523_010326 [Penicillium sp. IBT 18751x]
MGASLKQNFCLGLTDCTAIAPMAPPPFRAGKQCYRWTIPTADLRRDDLTQGYVQEPGVFMEFEGPIRRLVAYPCSDNNVINLSAFITVNTNQEADRDEGWQTRADKAVVVDAFSQFGTGIRKLIDSAPEQIKTWDMWNMQTLPTWALGHTALLGDAAHPFQPHMGQGGAMAIEDAVSIAMLLPFGTKPHDIPKRLELYQSSRLPRVEMILSFTSLMGRDDGRISLVAAEMVKFMGICVSYNEMENCEKLLETINFASRMSCTVSLYARRSCKIVALEECKSGSMSMTILQWPDSLGG